MTVRRISESLTMDRSRIYCRECKGPIGAAGKSWKHGVALREIALREVVGAHEGVSPRAVLRHFYCPHCALLLDTEVALPEDPFLVDLVTP